MVGLNDFFILVKYGDIQPDSFSRLKQLAQQFAVFTYFYSFFLPFVLKIFLEMPPLNRNDRVACLECGREYTHKDASGHRRTRGVLKCSNCNFYTYSGEEFTNHFKKKHCQHNV